MKAAVTGANGFIGSNLVERLLKSGWHVTGIVRETSDVHFLDGLDFPLLRIGLTDGEELAQAFDGADVVFHCASRSSDWGPFDCFRRANIDTTKNVMYAAAAAGIPRIVYIGSTVVYGFRGHVNSDETTPKKPDFFPYCITKLEAEWLVEEIARDEGMEFVIIRPGNVFGPHDRVTSIHLYKYLLEDKFAHINGGEALTCPVYVQNVVDALMLAATVPECANQDFIITDGLKINWREYINLTCEILGAPRPRRSFPSRLAMWAAAGAETIFKLFGSKTPPPITRYRIKQVSHDYHFSIDKASRLLHYKPQEDLEKAIQKTVEWYKGSVSDR